MVNISDIFKWRKFLIILFLSVFQTDRMICFTVRRHATATTNLWVDQCAVCSALKSDAFTLVTVTFEWLSRFRKTKIFVKIVDIKPVFHEKKLLKMLYFFQTHPVERCDCISFLEYKTPFLNYTAVITHLYHFIQSLYQFAIWVWCR